MSIIPPPHINYALKLSPAQIASDYAGWEFIERGFDERGSYVVIERDSYQYVLRGQIGDEWLVQNLTDEQIAAVL
jgi:hypothetical protein